MTLRSNSLVALIGIRVKKIDSVLPIFAQLLCLALLLSFSATNANATSQCEEIFGEVRPELVSIKPVDVAAFESDQAHFFSDESVSSAALLEDAERIWSQSGVRYERTQIIILGQKYNALRVLEDRQPVLLNQLAVDLKKGYISKLVYCPDFMRVRHANGAFSEADDLFLLPHDSILRADFKNYIVKHESRHFEAFVRRRKGQAILSDGNVKAKDNTQIWSGFKSDRGRYKVTVNTEEGDTYPGTFADVLGEIQSSWQSLPPAQRSVRLLDLRNRVREGTEISRQLKYVYDDVTKIFSENHDIENQKISVFEELGNRAQPGYSPVSFRVEGSTFIYTFNVPAKSRTANLVGLFKANDSRFTPNYKSEIQRDLLRVVDLKLRLLKKLTDESLTRGPKILLEIDRMLEDAGQLASMDPKVLDRLEIEISGYKRILDKSNAAFDFYVASLVPTAFEISRIEKLKSGGSAEKLLYLGHIIRIWNISQSFLPQGHLDTISGWLLDPGAPIEVRKKSYEYIKNYTYGPVSQKIFKDLSPTDLEAFEK